MSKKMLFIVSGDIATPIAKAAAAAETIHGAADLGVVSWGMLLGYLDHLSLIEDLPNL